MKLWCTWQVAVTQNGQTKCGCLAHANENHFFVCPHDQPANPDIAPSINGYKCEDYEKPYKPASPKPGGEEK